MPIYINIIIIIIIIIIIKRRILSRVAGFYFAGLKDCSN